MIVHAKVSKLNRYAGDTSFERVIAQISAATDEGIEDFEVDVHQLETEPKLDLLDALEVSGYTVTYDQSEELFYVSMD
jgi:hypothetical protein